MKIKKASSTEERIALFDAYGEELFEKENYAEAIKIYSQALTIRNRPNVKAYFAGQVGICHFNAGDDKEAFKFLKQSAQLFKPDKPEFMEDMYGFVHFHLGSLYEYHGNMMDSLKARQVCEQYIESQEKDTRWMLYAGIARNYEALGKHDEAIECQREETGGPCSQKCRCEVHAEPHSAAACARGDGCKHVIVFVESGHTHDGVARFVANDVDDIIDRNSPDEMVVVVDDCCRYEVVVLEQGSDIGRRRRCIDRRRSRFHEFRGRYVRVCRKQQRNEKVTEISAVTAYDEQRISAPRNGLAHA